MLYRKCGKNDVTTSTLCNLMLAKGDQKPRAAFVSIVRGGGGGYRQSTFCSQREEVIAYPCEKANYSNTSIKFII